MSPSSSAIEYFFKYVCYALDTYTQTYEKFFLAGDFNKGDTEPCLCNCLTSHDSKCLVKDKTYFKNPENLRCIGIDLFAIIWIGCFQKTTAVASGLPSFHQMIITECQTSFRKSNLKK